MAFQIEEISPTQYDAWDTLVSESFQGTVYHTSGWKRALDAGSRDKTRLLGCFDEGRLSGGCVLTEKVQLGYRAAVNALTAHYAGFLLPRCEGSKISDVLSREHEVLGSFAEFLARRYHQVHLFNSPGLKDVRPLLAAGWTVAPRYTYVVELGDEERLWDLLDGHVRRNIRKAEQEGFEIRASIDAGQMVDIMEKTFSRRALRRVLGSSLIRAICEDAALTGYRLAISAWHEETMASAIVALVDHRSAYYALAGTRGDYLSSGIHSLLIWELCKRLGGKVRRFDFVGANVPSIARFKEGFNPKLDIYFSVEKWTSFAFHCLKRVARQWRKMRSDFRAETR